MASNNRSWRTNRYINDYNKAENLNSYLYDAGSTELTGQVIFAAAPNSAASAGCCYPGSQFRAASINPGLGYCQRVCFCLKCNICVCVSGGTATLVPVYDCMSCCICLFCCASSGLVGCWTPVSTIQAGSAGMIMRIK